VNGSFGMTVSQVLNKFADQERLESALEEVKEAKAVAEKALHEKNKLQNEFSSGGDKKNELFDTCYFLYHNILIFIYT